RGLRFMAFAPARGQGLEQGQYFVDVGQLADEGVGTGAHGVLAVLAVVEVAGDDDVGVVVLGLDQAGGLQAAHLGHGQVHQHHVRAQHLALGDGLHAVSRGAGHGQPGQAAQVAQGGGDEAGMVVDQQHGNLAHHTYSWREGRAGRVAARRRARAGPIESWSRYLATVRRAMRMPWRASRPAITSSASGAFAGSSSIRRLTMALTAAPLTSAPSSRTANRRLSSKVPRGVWMYLPLTMRETVDSCMPIASATSRRVSGRIASGPWSRKPAWRSTSTWAVRSSVSLRMLTPRTSQRASSSRPRSTWWSLPASARSQCGAMRSRGAPRLDRATRQPPPARQAMTSGTMWPSSAATGACTGCGRSDRMVATAACTAPGSAPVAAASAS